MIKKTIYTIGYSGFKEVADFIKALQDNKITVLVDVRSLPFSSYFYNYNGDLLSKELKKNGIMYRNYAKEFGARQEDEQYYTDGYLDFSKFTQSEQFKTGMDKIIAGMDKGYTFVLMCAEKDPITCHRNIMIGRAFFKKGINVLNILPQGIEEQKDSQERLRKEYFQNGNYVQTTLFDTAEKTPMTIEDEIEESFKLRNKEIGFRKNSEDNRK